MLQYKKIDKQTVINEYCTKLNSVYKIKNNDNLCLLRSYIIGKATIDKDSNLKKLKRNGSLLLSRQAQELRRILNFNNESYCIREIKILDEYYSDYQLMVLNESCETLYLNSEKKCRKFIYLLHNGNHYDCILSMKAFYKRSYWCDYCKQGYNNAIDHSCRYTCKSCHRTECEHFSVIKCKICF